MFHALLMWCLDIHQMHCNVPWPGRGTLRSQRHPRLAQQPVALNWMRQTWKISWKHPTLESKTIWYSKLFQRPANTVVCIYSCSFEAVESWNCIWTLRPSRLAAAHRRILSSSWLQDPKVFKWFDKVPNLCRGFLSQRGLKMPKISLKIIKVYSPFWTKGTGPTNCNTNE